MLDALRIAPALLTAALSALALAQAPAKPAAPAKSAAPAAPAQEQAPAQAPPTSGADEARSALERGVRYLAKAQRPDGAWGAAANDSVQFVGFSVETYYDFQLGANALAFAALLSVDETAPIRAALDKSLEWLLAARMPKRGNDWDVDQAWPAVYGFQAMVLASRDARFGAGASKARIEARGREFYELLARTQSPEGGWGYYEGPVVSQRPTWATSFTTAAVVPALVRARELGWPVDPKLIDRAVRYLELCRLPSGAYAYDYRPLPRAVGESIDNVKGSLGRIQACNFALRRAGAKKITDDVVRAGLEAFFEHHKFLDVGRMRSEPHEAYYAVAPYFYMFAHGYAGLLIGELPEAERASWHARLRPHLQKVQWEDGSSLDFPNMSCMQVAGTAFSVLALQAGLGGARTLP